MYPCIFFCSFRLDILRTFRFGVHARGLCIFSGAEAVLVSKWFNPHLRRAQSTESTINLNIFEENMLYSKSNTRGTYFLVVFLIASWGTYTIVNAEFILFCNLLRVKPWFNNSYKLLLHCMITEWDVTALYQFKGFVRANMR